MKTIEYVDTETHLLSPYLQAKIFAIDIETNTEPPPGSLWKKGSFGLSNSAPITYVSVSAKGMIPLVIKLLPVEGDYNWETLDTERRMVEAAKHQFIVDLFTRAQQKPYRVIGHNLVFDIGRLGARFGFLPEPQMKAWCTMTMAARFMLGETNDDMNLYELGLDAQLDMYGRRTIWYEHDDTIFYKTMKSKYRKNFAQLPIDFKLHILECYYDKTGNLRQHSSTLPYIAEDTNKQKLLEDALFAEVEFVIHQCSFHREKYASPEEYKAFVELTWMQYESDTLTYASDLLAAHYVAMDTVYTYDLYSLQLRAIDDAEHGEVNIPVEHPYTKVRTIPHWPNIKELVAFEQNMTRELCRQTVVGVPVDRNYVAETKQKWIDTFPVVADTLINMLDPSDPDESFRERAMMVYWYSRIIALFRGHYTENSKHKSEVSYSDPRKWVNWSYTQWNAVDLMTLLDFSEVPASTEPEYMGWMTMWCNALAAIRPDTPRNKIFKGVADIPFEITRRKPKLDFVEWVYKECFEGVEDGRTLAKWKAEWLAFYFSRTASSNLTPEKLPKNKKFQRYYTFVVSAIPIPNHDTVKYGTKLATPSHGDYVRDMKALHREIRKAVEDPNLERNLTTEEGLLLQKEEWRNKKTKVGYLTWADAVQQSDDLRDVEPDYKAVALNYEWLSITKKGMMFYLPPEEDDNDEPNPAHYDHPLRQLHDAIDLLSLIASADKYLLHSERDGRIHSVMSRSTRTGRCLSNNPNMQNDAREKVKGWIVPIDDTFVVVGIDLSNAENVSGALISGDSAFAMSTEQGDYHMNRAWVYFKEQMQHAEETGNVEKMFQFRGAGKPLTFGDAYNQGAEGMAINSGLPLEEVIKIKEELLAAYPQLAKAKVDTEKMAEAITTYPSYTTLFDGSRVTVPIGERWYFGKKTIKPQGRKGWNYKQQGMVGVIIARAMVLVQDWLVENGYETFVMFNVHDELVLCLKIAEVDVVIPTICEIMGEIVPIELRERTIPMTHFVADLGPENAFKWGYQEGVTYPLNLDCFWNRYGKHMFDEETLKKPPHKRKTPTWRGNIAKGWTLEDEMQELRARRASAYKADTQEDDIHAQTSDTTKAWLDFKLIYLALCERKDELGITGTLLAPRSITIPYKHEYREIPGLMFEEWMELGYIAYHRGHSSLYRKGITSILSALDLAIQHEIALVSVAAWIDSYSHLVNEVNK